MKGYYEDFRGFGRRKNKANSKPIAGLWPEILNQDEGCGMANESADF